MTQEEQYIQRRILDLAQQSYRNNQYTFTHFLTLAEQDVFYRTQHEIGGVAWQMSGGAPECERQVLRFGDKESLGYEEEFPIVCLEIRPVIEKFVDKLSHRDYLGALMHLGIAREMLGDILQQGNVGYLFCLEQISAFIQENLTKIKHTQVRCRVLDGVPEAVRPKLQEASLVVSSPRADGIIAKTYHLSRSQCLPLFREKRIAVNGRILEQQSMQLSEGDVVSVRGYGKFIYRGCSRQTKKGKFRIQIAQYI